MRHGLLFSTAALLGGTSLVAAHGFVAHLVTKGLAYQGFDPSKTTNPKDLIAWAAVNTNFGPAEPINGPDIICAENGTNGAGHASVNAGDVIQLHWNTWETDHMGPVLDYLAACNGSCETVDKTKLEFFKIDAVGLVKAGATPLWASIELMKNNLTWTVQIPTFIPTGNYVLRHEIISLGGPQAYPQCFNLAITGNGTTLPQGTLGEQLYNSADPSLTLDTGGPLSTYVVPGPSLIPGVSSSISQLSTMVVTAIGTPTAPSAAGNTAGAAVGPAAAAPTSAPPAASPPLAPLAPPAPSPTSVSPTLNPVNSLTAIAGPAGMIPVYEAALPTPC